MVATKGQAIALGVVSCLVVGSGIAVMVVFHFLFDSVAEANSGAPVLAIFWPYALPALLTGVLGIVAAAVRNNVVIGIYMGICIICLIILAAFVILIGIAFFVLLNPAVQTQISYCGMVLGRCTCYSTPALLGASVEECENPVNVLIRLARAGCALIIVSWLLMLAGSIISCTACCCGKPARSTGVVIVPGGSPAYEMGYSK